jgi:hypothetical protein
MNGCAVQLAQALKKEGGIAILRGNLAPGGCVIKISGQSKDHHRGPARVFERVRGDQGGVFAKYARLVADAFQGEATGEHRIR